MKKVRSLWKIAAAVLVSAGLVFAGCDLSTGSGNGSGNENGDNTQNGSSSGGDSGSSGGSSGGSESGSSGGDSGSTGGEETYETSAIDNTLYTVAVPGCEDFDDSSYESLSALDFSKIMGNGINLGNTMEATSSSYPGYNASDASLYETMWGQPVTTEAMFAAMKAAGFDCVRIPVAWTNTMDWSRGDFTINTNYLERVAEVVDWALDSGLIVMINDHWDYQWWGLFSHDEELAWKIYASIWSQVGNYFRDYDYRLIFEGGNEELGTRFNDILDTTVDSRLDSSAVNYSTEGTLTAAECYAMNKRVGQRFVNLIRAQGGKNAKRFLLIPGYDTDFDATCSSSYGMPSDATNTVNKLFVSVHYYMPSTYCIASDPSNSWGYSDTWGTDSDVDTQNGYFYEMKKFTDAGYGVMIGEYGCALANETTRKTGDVEWMTNVLDNCDTYNYVPFMWDCNTYFKKTGTLGFGDSDVAAIFDGRNYAAEAAGTSDGGTITYGMTTAYSADSVTLSLSGTDYGKDISLSSSLSVTAGQTVTLKFDRPEITANYAGHILRLYNGSTLICNSDPNWCSAGTYPAAASTSISIEFTPAADCTVTKFNVQVCSPYGSDTSDYTSSTMKITGVTLTVK